MVRRGCEDLEELEAVEEKERLERSRDEALSEVQLLEDHGVIDWSSLADSSSTPDYGVIFSSVGGKA